MKPLRYAIIFVVVALIAPVLRADTGQLREVASGNGIHAVVFTAPTPLRAGLVEVTVLVTDSVSRAPLEACEVDVSYRRSDWAEDDPSMVIGAGPDPSDGFVQKAILDIPEKGAWEFLVEVRFEGRSLEIPVSVSVGAPMPAWWQILPIALSGAPFLLLVVMRDRLSFKRDRARKGFGRDQIDALRRKRPNEYDHASSG